MHVYWRPLFVWFIFWLIYARLIQCSFMIVAFIMIMMMIVVVGWLSWSRDFSMVSLLAIRIQQSVFIIISMMLWNDLCAFFWHHSSSPQLLTHNLLICCPNLTIIHTSCVWKMQIIIIHDAQMRSNDSPSHLALLFTLCLFWGHISRWAHSFTHSLWSAINGQNNGAWSFLHLSSIINNQRKIVQNIEDVMPLSRSHAPFGPGANCHGPNMASALHYKELALSRKSIILYVWFLLPNLLNNLLNMQRTLTHSNTYAHEYDTCYYNITKYYNIIIYFPSPSLLISQ